MDLVQFAKELGYGDITKPDNYDVNLMYVDESGETKSKGYIQVCSDLLYNKLFEGAIDPQFADPLDPFSVTYLVADSELLRSWFVQCGMHYFSDEPESIFNERERLNITRTAPFKHPIW